MVLLFFVVMYLAWLSHGQVPSFFLCLYGLLAIHFAIIASTLHFNHILSYPLLLFDQLFIQFSLLFCVERMIDLRFASVLRERVILEMILSVRLKAILLLEHSIVWMTSNFVFLICDHFLQFDKFVYRLWFSQTEGTIDVYGFPMHNLLIPCYFNLIFASLLSQRHLVVNNKNKVD